MEHHENVLKCFLYQVPPSLKISWKSVQPFSVMLLTDRQTNRQSNGQRWKHNFRHGGGKYRSVDKQKHPNGTVSFFVNDLETTLNEMDIWNTMQISYQEDIFGNVIYRLMAISLTHPLDKLPAISQTIFSYAFSWMKNVLFWLKFHWSFFLEVQLSITQHWFR